MNNSVKIFYITLNISLWDGLKVANDVSGYQIVESIDKLAF